LAAAARYIGGVSFVGVIAVWVLFEWRSAERGRKMGAAAVGAAGAVLIAAPYTLLDLPSFLDRFASLFGQGAGAAPAAEPAWALSAPRLWIDAPLELILAVVGLPIVLVRGPARPWSAVIVVGAAYSYVLSSHAHVVGRDVLPLLPIVCLIASAAALEFLDRAA